ncbi:MAG: YhjD/YihY/BrkB family envelope integrity protein [Thermoanaerobaculia bacterium]|nr:YhjD/YihY/BrkB family envelope integrity protein [Thermoanaerobaculia bacterium]
MLPARLQRLRAELLERISDPDARPESRARRLGLRALRVAHGVARDLAAGSLTLQAMGLVYTSLLSLVPLLAVTISILKVFNADRHAEPLLTEYLAPLGPRGEELSNQIMAWVETLDVGVLGGLGLAFLLYSVVSLIQKIERAFNSTWHITRRQQLAKRIGDYLSVILVGPVLIFSVLGAVARVTAPLLSWAPLSFLAGISGRLVPYLLVVGAFTLIYLYVPNTRVRLTSGLTGAVVAGVAWQSLGWLFASVVVGSARFSGITSGFAVVLLFMIWLYLNWLLLLIGASIAFHHQHPEYLLLDPTGMRLSARLREKLALRAAYLIGKNHFESGPPWSVDALANRLRLPAEAVSRTLDALESAGLLAVTGEEDDRYLPARALEKISVSDILEAVRAADEGPLSSPSRMPAEESVDALERRIEEAVHQAVGEATLRDLVLAGQAGQTISQVG